MASDTYHLYSELGYFATPSRILNTEAMLGVKHLQGTTEANDHIRILNHQEAGEAMAARFTNATETCCDMARSAFKTHGISTSYIENAKVIFEENGISFPTGVEPMLKTLTEAFNGISDANEINQIQKEIVSVVDDANIGLKLAQKVRHAFKNTRKKDALAAKICLLTQAIDASIARQELAHRRNFTIPPGPLRKLLTVLMQRFMCGATADTVLQGLSTAQIQMLCEYFGVAEAELGAAAEAHAAAAADSRRVEESMH